jgi:alcohol dehydrogenase class IV
LDVDPTLTVPAGLTVTSGVNPIAHAVEGLYARDGNPVDQPIRPATASDVSRTPCRGP